MDSASPSSSPSAAQVIADLIERMGRLAHTQQFAADLNPAQWEALRYLSRANRFSRSPSALAAFFGATKGTTSQTLIALERKGLVVRLRSENDRRSVVLHLTAAGRARLADDPLAMLAAAAGDLAPELQRPLLEGLHHILFAMQRRNGHKPFGQCRTCRFFVHETAAEAAGEPHFCRLLDVPLNREDTEGICHQQVPSRAVA